MTAPRAATAALFAAILWAGASDATLQIERAEATRHALIVEGESGAEGIARLAEVLASRYGFQVVRVAAPEADRKTIERAMSELYDRVRPYDELVVFLALPVLESRLGGTWYIPPLGELDKPWTLLAVRDLVAWMTRLPLGAGLLMHPSCAGVIAEGGASELEVLGYGQRPGAVDVLVVCDLLAALQEHGALAGVDWRADEVAATMAEHVDVTAGPDGLGVDSAELAAALAAAQEGLRTTIRSYPSGANAFRFQPTATESGYRARYQRTPSCDDARSVLLDFAAAADRPALQNGLIRLLTEVAASERAFGPGGCTDERGQLEMRRVAVELLREHGGTSEAARDALAAVIRDATDSASVRAYAVSALSRLPVLRPRDRGALRRAFDDADPGVREAALLGLTVVKDADAASAYRGLGASDPSVSVRIAALQALAALGRADDRAFFLRLLDDRQPEVRRTVAAALAGLGASGTAGTALLERLRADSDEQVRQAAAYALGDVVAGATRAEVTAGLVAALDDGSEAVARAAAAALGRVGGEEAELALIRALTGRTRVGVRVAAAESLGRLGRTVAVIDVLERLADIECTRAVGEGVDKFRPEPDLVHHCVEPPTVRRAAVSALAAIGGQRTASILFRKLEDPDPFVRREASRALGEDRAAREFFLANAAFDVESFSVDTRQLTYRSLDVEDPHSLDVLLRGLADPSREAREQAIESLALVSLPSAVERIASALAGGDVLTRQSAATVLGRIGLRDPMVVDALTAGARDPSSAVRAESLRALGVRRDLRSLEALIAGLNDPVVEVRRVAAESLSWARDEPMVRDWLEGVASADPAHEVRAAAVGALTGAEGVAKRW